MPSISEAISRLKSGQAAGHLSGLPDDLLTDFTGRAQPSSSRLQRLTSFGRNPGALDGWYYMPATTGKLPLVVVLHGCTQSAAGYDHGSGWSDLAERFGFAVLFPEQQRANNSNLCFNWFSEADIRRGSGEALSIRQMIAFVAERYPIDAERVFVTGLSAGGAMANVMLATYPELFASGSIIAGLPYGAATSVPHALQRMRGAGHASATDYADLVRGASHHRGEWPRVTVWHGDADCTVAHSNAGAIVAQWCGVHGVHDRPNLIDIVDGQQHRVWLDLSGNIAVEEYVIAGLSHGTPLKTAGADSCGNVGAYMLEAGISSTWRQAQSWGLIDAKDSSAEAAPGTRCEQEPQERETALHNDLVAGVNATIGRALRSAGLMR